MSNRKPFADRLLEAIDARGTPCIVGLDPAPERMAPAFLAEQGFPDGLPATATAKQGAELLFAFCAAVIDQVADLVPAVKPQSAYFERYGAAGIDALERVVAHARSSGLLVILDVKRGDIDATSEAYAEAYVGGGPANPLACDCMTLSPYLGEDGLAPFFKACLAHGTGAFVCVKTSNPGAAALQDLRFDGKPLFQVVADLIAPWVERGRGTSGYSSIGAVVGATYPEQAALLRRQLPSALFLVPGFGAQGGAEEGVRACFNADGRGAVVNSSRAVLYPHLYGQADVAPRQAIRRAAEQFIARVRACLRG